MRINIYEVQGYKGRQIYVYMCIWVYGGKFIIPFRFQQLWTFFLYSKKKSDFLGVWDKWKPR